MTVQFFLTALVVVITPGTGVIYTLTVGLGQGRRAAVWAALGCTLGIAPHLAAAVFGLAAILYSSALLFQIVRLAGVLYLLYLAWQALKSDGALKISANQQRLAVWGIVRRGALINILNPKLSIFFLALLPPFLSGAPETATLELAVLGAVFSAMTFIVFVVYGQFSAIARDCLLSSDRALLWLNRGIAAVFATLALRLAAERA